MSAMASKATVVWLRDELRVHEMLQYGLMMWASSGCWGGTVQLGQDDFGRAPAQANLEACRRNIGARASSDFPYATGPYSQGALLRAPPPLLKREAERSATAARTRLWPTAE